MRPLHSSQSLAWLIAVSLLGALLHGAPSALAQVLTKDQQLCSDAMAQSFQKVVATLGKGICSCIKSGGQGKLAGTIEACTTADAKGKVRKSQAKAVERFAKRCPAGALPPFGVTDPATIGKAARAKELNLFHDVFGDDLDAAIIAEEDDKAAAKCQQAIAKDLKKCQDTKLKAFAKCKKDGLKAKVDPIDSASDLEGCIGADPKGSVAKACNLSVLVKGNLKVDKIRKDLAKQCTDEGVSLATAFPGCAADDPEEAHACLDAAVGCRVCVALNAADGLDRDCDAFDDGLTNDSCVAGLFIGRQECEVTGSFNAELAGGLFIGNVLAGNLQIDCGNVSPGTMQAPCSCTLLDMDPAQVSGFGVACFHPVSGCGPGLVDCDGGQTRDIAMTTSHDIGTCRHNADCAVQCATFCAGDAVFESGCEGFCRGGARADQPCVTDASCPGGTCNGIDGVSHGSACGCHCIDERSGGPALPGALRCNLGVGITVEQALPCDGRDVVIPIGEHCVPLTTELASGRILGGNDDPDAIIPTSDNSLPGAPVTCATLEGSDLSAQVLVSTINFLDAPVLGDTSFQFQLGCQ